MVINVQNVKVEAGERKYIKYVGVTVLKVVQVTQGVSGNNNPQIKVHMIDKEGSYITDTFVLVDSALWRLKLFAQALEVPSDIINTDHFYDRYTKATIKDKKTSNDGLIYEIKKHEKAKANKPFVVPSIETVFQGETVQENVSNAREKANINNIDEDEIPF